MDKSNYLIITEAVEKLLFEKGFKLSSDESLEYYSNGEKAVMIEYDAKGLLCLKSATLQEGQGVEWKVMSSWAMDEKTPDRDKSSIANDFIDSINDFMGVKLTQTRTQVDLPSKHLKADTVDIESFTARFLAIYPTLKDAYKQNVTLYNEFLYDEFFKTHGVATFSEVLTGGVKKNINKYMEWLSSCYTNGDNAVTTTIVYTIVAGTLIKYPTLEKAAFEYMDKYTYLKKDCVNMLNLLKKPKNAKKYL
ncbi:MAG: hypothetical protein IJF54_06435 [Clostridia bacterium]|nr:hypothetical protein [Clostridia bacterium]